MWQGFYKKWNPIPILEDKCLYVEAVHDDWEGFRIWFTSENTKLGVILIIKFEDALLYIKSNESFRLSSVENSEEMKFPHLFWKVENSDLIKEFHRQSLDIYKDWKIQHFALLSGEDCIDVLSVDEPTFEKLFERNFVLMKEIESAD